MDWIYLIQGRKKWLFLMNMAMNVSISEM